MGGRAQREHKAEVMLRLEERCGCDWRDWRSRRELSSPTEPRAGSERLLVKGKLADCWPTFYDARYLTPVTRPTTANTPITTAKTTWAVMELETRESNPMPTTGTELPA